MSTKLSRHRIVQVFAAAMLVLTSVLVTTSISHGQASRWSRPVRLSPEGQFSWFPDVTTDALGHVHVAWGSGFKGYDTVMYTASLNSREWSVVNDIAALPQSAGSEATRPTLLVDRRGLLHLTFRYTTVYYSQAPTDSAYSASSWLTARPMSNKAQVAYFSRLALDGQGTLHLIYTENTQSATCVSCYHVYYRQSHDNGLTWSNPLDISGSGTGSAKPQIVVDGQDNLHVVWEAGEGGSYGKVGEPVSLRYAASYDLGKTWTLPTEFVALEGDNMAQNIALGLDGEGHLLVVWLAVPEDVVYYQVSSDQGQSWSEPQPISGVWSGWATYNSPLDAYAMATDSAGDVHLVLVGRLAEEEKSLSVLHLTWDGAKWSEPEAVTTYAGDAPEWPRIAIGNGNQLHVVWTVRDEKNIWIPDKGKFQVWYAHGVSAAPAATAVLESTPTPSPEVEVTQISEQTPEPVVTPTPKPVLSGNADTTYTVYNEVDGLILVAISLIPTVLVVLVVGVIVGIRIRRR